LSSSRNMTQERRKSFEMAFGFERVNEESWLQWRLWHGHEFIPSNVGGRQFRSIFEWRGGLRNKKQNTQGEGANRVHCTIKFMIVKFLSWQSVLLTSKVDGGMHMRGSVNIWEDIFSWGNSIHKNSVKDCKISTSI
jgi:hypothetical protein